VCVRTPVRSNAWNVETFCSFATEWEPLTHFYVIFSQKVRIAVIVPIRMHEISHRIISLFYDCRWFCVHYSLWTPSQVSLGLESHEDMLSPGRRWCGGSRHRAPYDYGFCPRLSSWNDFRCLVGPFPSGVPRSTCHWHRSGHSPAAAAAQRFPRIQVWHAFLDTGLGRPA